jgi:hypothetical protein
MRKLWKEHPFGVITFALIAMIIAFGSLLFGEAQPRARVHFRSNITGFSGRGEPIAYDDAKAWVDKLNSEYPDLTHWLVREGS